MPLFGKIVVIKRNGTDGIHFPLTASSCLFGRKTECDIRIQLPQVSKEHCKIEVNENKEAVLINLSTVNPTQLNGNSFQQPAHLKHGDVFTIVDRSFRFEYPPQSTPRKRLSRTPKNETLQVLHVQQVAEVELQSPTSKSPHTSDKNIECEGQNFGENDKQSTEEDISRVVPAKQHATPKSTYRTAKSNRRENEMSPFSKLYELLKNEIDVKTQKDGNEEIPMPRQAETNAQQISLLVFPSSQETQTKEKETIIGEDIEQSYVKEQEINNVELNQISTEGNSSKKTNEISSANSGEPRTGQDSSLGVKATEISNEIQKKDVVCSSVGGNESCILGKSNKYSKQRRNSKQLTPRKSLNAEEVLKEIHYETSSVSVTKERDSETVAFSPGYSNSKSPKGSVRQSKKNSNKSPLSQLLTPERLTPKDESPASRKHHSGARRGRRMSSGKMAEETLERDPSQEHYKNVDIKGSDVKEKLTTENYQQKLEVEDANIVLGPHRLSSKRRCSESVVLLRDDEVASEINISSLPTEDKKSGETKRLPQKRKSREIELLHQPLGKRKRVSFGGHLSPELFDKSLPPNSPLRRGAIPARLSLPFGNSPRAVLKKGQGFKRLVIKDLSEHLQRQKSSQKNLPARRSPAASPPARRSPVASPPARRSPVASPPARRSPVASPPARRSPVASPPARRSPAASPPALEKMSPKLTANSPSNTPFTKGRFSISHISTPSPTSKEQGTAATEVKESDGDFTGVKTPESFHINQEHQISVPTTPKQLIRRSIRFSVKRTPMKRRSDAVETIHSKRRSGASKANLLVAKSWAEVVKLGVARPQVKAVKKCVLKGKSAKKLTKSPKTPARKVKGHFSTGHADSPATIVIGRAHATRVKLVGQAPRVVKNCALKQNMDINESFTGMTEMFRTPVNENQKSPSLSAAHKTDLTPSCAEVEGSEVHTPEESGEMVISPLSISGMSQQRKDSQDVVSRFLRVEKSPNSAFVAVKLKQTPKKERTVLEEKVEMSNPLVMPEKHITEMTVGAKRLVKTPKQKMEPVEPLSGVKRLLRTPKQKMEPVEALSGVKRLLRTPKQKTEPVEALSGVKRLLRTPKQKTEPIEALSGVKRLLRTPKEKTEPIEALSGIKRLLRTPKQKTEPIEALSGIKRLLRTPKQKTKSVEVLSGIKRLLRTPEQKTELLTDEIALKRLLKTPAQKKQVVNDLVGVSFMKTTRKQKCQSVEDMIGISHMKRSKQRIQSEDTVGMKRLLKTSRERVEPVEDLFGISRLLRTPREKYLPVDDFVGLQKLMAEPKQKYSNSELDFAGVKEIFDTPKEIKVKVTDLMQENNSPHIDPKSEHESRGNYERGLKQEKKMEDSLEKTSLPFVRSRNGNIKNEQELQESLEHACISPKESESVKNIENIEKEKMSNGSQTQSHNLSNSVISLLLTKMDPVQEPAMQLQRELNQYLKDSDDKELLFENPVAPQLNLIQESIDLSSKDKKSTRAKQQKIEIKENPSSLRECEENLKENVNLLELPVLMKERIEDQKEEAVAFTSVVKNLGRKERTNQCMQEEIISKIHVHKQLDKNKEAVSSVEINGTFHSSRRGKRSLESHDKDSLMLQRETTSMKQNLQTVHQSVTNHILIMENDQSLKTANVSSSSKNVRGHTLQIGLIAPEDKSDQDSVKNNEKVALSVRKRSRGEKKLVPAKRTRRGKTEDNKQGFTEEHDAKEKPQRQTTRNPCRAETAKCIQTDEQDFAHSIIEAAAVEESEINKPTLEIMVTEMKGRKSLRVKSRKQLEETEKVSTEMGPESVRPVQETKRTSKETVVKTHKAIKNETKAVQGTKEAETGQSLKLKKSHFENTNEAPLDVYSLQANRNSIKKTNQRHGNKRGQKGILDIKEGEFAKNEKMIPQNIPETEPETISTKDSLGSLQTVQNSKTKEAQNNPTAAMVYGPKDVERTVLRHGKRIRKGDGKQEASETKQIEILENNPTEANENTSRRDREKKVHFELEEANSASLRGKHILPEGNDKDQNETSENIPSQANENLSRRGRRKEVDLTPHAVSSTFLREKYSLPESDAKKEAPKKDQVAALESTASPTKENTSRRGRRKQVDHKALAANSTSFGGKCSLPGDSSKEEMSEDQNVPLEAIVSPTKEKLSRRGRRNQVSLTSRAASCTSLRGKSSLTENDDKDAIPKEDQNVPLGSTTSQAKANPPRKGRRKQVDLTTQAARSTSLRGKSSLPENDGKEKVPKEDLNVTLGNTTEAKANPPRKGRRKQVDLTTQATRSTSLRGKSSLPENDNKEKTPKEDQNVPLENITSQASKRGRRKQVNLTTQAASSTSLRGKSSLPENDGKEKVPKEDPNVTLGNTTEAKANPPRKGRRKQVDLTTQATRSTSLRGKSSLPENDNKEKTPKENQNVPLENITSQASKRGRRKQVDLTTQAASSTPLRGKSSLPENDGKEKVPKEDPNVPLGNTTEEKANPPRKGRRKQVDLMTQAASSTSLRGKSSLPENDDKEKVPKEDQNVPLGNTTEAKANPPRKGRRKQVDLTTQAASSTSLRGKSSLPENDNKEKTPKEDQNVPLENITSQASKRGRRKQVDLTSQATNSTSLRGKRHLPEDEKAAKKLKSECGESTTQQKETRNKTKGELGKGGISMIQSAGGTERKTRASARTRK
ncbi:proliferation marker protein Ki-67 isoform X2 [Malaclemys terrapin pileata]|nr:proliferation marker protein Ki-67 isoform X2 [Malaclemys terrapin pileata]